MNKNRVSYLNCIPRLLAETARISELAARNYYKNCVKKVGILELDEFIILCHIISNPKLTQSDLAKLLYKGKAHVGKILNVMEEKGYIERIISTNNNIMVKYTEITPKGKELHKITDDIFSKMNTELFQNFTQEELLIFNALLAKLQAAILKNHKLEF